MNIEEFKKIVRGNGFQENHGSTTMVIDVETVVDLIDELKQCDIPIVSQQRELLEAFRQHFNKNNHYEHHIYEADMEDFIDSL